MFYVVGTEISQVAIAAAKEKIRQANLEEKIIVQEKSAGERQDFPDGHFDLILDMMVLHLLTPQERDVYAQEVVRLLAPAGHFLFYTIYADSPAAQDLFQRSPGPESNSYVIPQSGMIEKCFTQVEITQSFSPLKVVSLQTKTEFTPAFGDIFERVYLQGLLEK